MLYNYVASKNKHKSLLYNRLAVTAILFTVTKSEDVDILVTLINTGFHHMLYDLRGLGSGSMQSERTIGQSTSMQRVAVVI